MVASAASKERKIWGVPLFCSPSSLQGQCIYSPDLSPGASCRPQPARKSHAEYRARLAILEAGLPAFAWKTGRSGCILGPPRRKSKDTNVVPLAV